MAKISIVVPVYNVEKYIRRCVESIRVQTFVDFELILVDDGSPDKCGDICEQYASIDKRIVVIHQKNGGPSVARNTGIDYALMNATSKWIGFVDSDDYVHPRYLETLYSALMETDVSVACCAHSRTSGEVFDNKFDDSVVLIESAETYYGTNNANATVVWGKLYEISYFREVRFPAGKIHEDEFVTWKILFKAGNVAFVNQPLYSYYRNENGIVKGGWSPSYVFGIDAIWEQINFFESNGYAELIDQRMRLMLFTLYRWIRLVLNAGDDESLKNLKMLSQKMKKSLRLYRKYLSAFNIYERFSFYCLASGNPMVIKWVIKNDFEPLQKIFAKLKS